MSFSDAPHRTRNTLGWLSLGVAVAGAAYGIVASFVSVQKDQAETGRRMDKVESRIERVEHDRELMDRIQGLEKSMVEMRSEIQWMHDDVSELKRRRK